jgi:hypothetical protein
MKLRGVIAIICANCLVFPFVTNATVYGLYVGTLPFAGCHMNFLELNNSIFFN